MAKFSKMMLIEGLEEILTNPDFETGVDIVSTINVLIERGIVENEGKVKTIVSERTFEGHDEGSETDDEDEGTDAAKTAQKTAAKAAKAAPPISSFPQVIAIAKALDAKMQASPTLVEPELAALMDAMSNNINLADRLAKETTAGEGGGSSYPSAVTTVADALVDKLAEDEQLALQFLEELYPIVTRGEIPKVEETPQFSEKTVKIMQRLERLPERYMDILSQLLENWEKQAK